jgi:hypothetical protein
VKILALEEELPGVAPAQYTPLLKAEAQRLWELYLEGGVREIFFRADRKSAVLVLEFPTVEDAQAQLETLPLVRQRLIRFTLIPLAPYPGFARLFSPQGALPRAD